METAHGLKPHKPQQDFLTLLRLFFGEIHHLRRIRFPRILDVFEP